MMNYQILKDLLKIPKPMSFTQNWYSKPIPPDIQFKERVFQPQFSVSTNKLYKWNIVEQKIMSHMSEVGIAYQNKHDIDQLDIVNLFVNGFSSTLCEWWDLYPTSCRFIPFLNILLVLLIFLLIFHLKFLVC